MAKSGNIGIIIGAFYEYTTTLTTSLRLYDYFALKAIATVSSPLIY